MERGEWEEYQPPRPPVPFGEVEAWLRLNKGQRETSFDLVGRLPQSLEYSWEMVWFGSHSHQLVLGFGCLLGEYLRRRLEARRRADEAKEKDSGAWATNPGASLMRWPSETELWDGFRKLWRAVDPEGEKKRSEDASYVSKYRSVSEEEARRFIADVRAEAVNRNIQVWMVIGVRTEESEKAFQI